MSLTFAIDEVAERYVYVYINPTNQKKTSTQQDSVVRETYRYRSNL